MPGRTSLICIPPELLARSVQPEIHVCPVVGCPGGGSLFLVGDGAALEQLSLYHDMPNPTVASIVERLQSTAVPCSKAWDIHDLLQLPASIEEQRPLDLDTMRSRDVESSISGQSPSVTAGPVGSSDGALEGFLPSKFCAQ